MSSGEQILPETRHLASDAVVDEWSESSDVMVGEDVIGKIQSRRLDDGRVEHGLHNGEWRDRNAQGPVSDVGHAHGGVVQKRQRDGA